MPATTFFSGYLQRCKMKLIHGVGFNDRKYPAAMIDKNKPTREYDLWRNMIGRCYNENIIKDHPTYTGCSVADEFKSYSYFYEWCQDQIGFSRVDKVNLDKDLIGCGKIYSPDNCLFLPPMVNGVLATTKAKRGNLPIGVSIYKPNGKYRAQIKRYNKVYNLGYFDNPFDAFYKYKEAREAHLKDVAQKYKDQIDPRAYEALMNYKVEITD